MNAPPAGFQIPAIAVRFRSLAKGRRITHSAKMKVFLLMSALMISPAFCEEPPSIDAILRSVQKKAPDATGMPEDIEISADKLTQPPTAELLFHRSVVREGDRRLQILHAITILNSGIAYCEESRAAEQEEYKDDYSKMVQFRARLADEYVRLTKIKAPAKAQK